MLCSLSQSFTTSTLTSSMEISSILRKVIADAAKRSFDSELASLSSLMATIFVSPSTSFATSSPKSSLTLSIDLSVSSTTS